MSSKTNTNNSTVKQEPKKEEPKKEEPKKEQEKVQPKEDPKKQEQKQVNQKVEDNKKVEPKKEEPKKEEPKKEEPKKEEPKKEEPKKEEPKKEEPKKEEPKKEEPKKQEPKKEEPKKEEPKKEEPKKEEPKKEEPKKEEPKKEEPKKEEPKKVEDKKVDNNKSPKNLQLPNLKQDVSPNRQSTTPLKNRLNVNLTDGFLINSNLSANSTSAGDISMTQVVKSVKLNEKTMVIKNIEVEQKVGLQDYKNPTKVQKQTQELKVVNLNNHDKPVHHIDDLFVGQENYLFKSKKGQFKAEVYRESFLKDNEQNIKMLTIPDRPIKQEVVTYQNIQLNKEDLKKINPVPQFIPDDTFQFVKQEPEEGEMEQSNVHQKNEPQKMQTKDVNKEVKPPGKLVIQEKDVFLLKNDEQGIHYESILPLKFYDKKVEEFGYKINEKQQINPKEIDLNSSFGYSGRKISVSPLRYSNIKVPQPKTKIPSPKKDVREQSKERQEVPNPLFDKNLADFGGSDKNLLIYEIMDADIKRKSARNSPQREQSPQKNAEFQLTNYDQAQESTNPLS